ncbi:hypothetical protein OWR29_25725 [Actinoplanes sp. Pm04-4]|uniref:Uncharacterized protein n=1 Tax=Paractinoplanes pyxinae TaxID=2997416 RepID=A0ABT4B4I3_9ACTN|nr:hypothetical protein [Actinoplanes pyxinae]MCY1141412.1 hypothetical protein [Actinoplanes pyxinae]
MRQHPLKESLILRIVAQLMIEIEPQRGCEIERDNDERRCRQHVTPVGSPSPPPFCRLPGLLRGGLDIGPGGRRRRRRGVGLERDQLGFEVVGFGHLTGRQHVPASRLACRVNTRNRHSVGEPNRGW